jgi:spermidine synthase
MHQVCFYSGLFLITAATLMLQVIQTRILSVVAWYHLAFFVISLALFGLTAGAIWVYGRSQRAVVSTLPSDLTCFSGAFALSTALSLVMQMLLAPTATPIALALLMWVGFVGCLAVPFFFAGVVISLALTRSPYPIGRVYGVDLGGAAAGCLGALALLNHTDGPTAVLWVGTLAALGALLFSRTARGTAPGGPLLLAWLLRRPSLVVVLLGACVVANSLAPRGLHPLFVKGQRETPPLFEAWNSFSRIAVFAHDNPAPQMWGPSPTFRPDAWAVQQRRMNIDGDAGTTTYRFTGDTAQAAFLRYDVTHLAYFLPGLARAAVIGIGGGRDMLAARVFGVPDITGVELNPIFVRLLTQHPEFAAFAGLRRLAGLTFAVDEARSWFARTPQTFDLIQMSLIDTWAATGAGAFTLSENGLYTVEAWRIFLQRLTPTGVFTVSRWYDPDAVNETGRMVSLAMATAFESGMPEPRRHIFVAASGRIATLVLSRLPLSSSQLVALEQAAVEMGYTVLIHPNTAPAAEVLRTMLASPNRAALERYTAGLPLDMTPPTDERPFFFNQLPLYNPLQTLRLAFAIDITHVTSGNLLATVTLIGLFSLSTLLVGATIILPIRPAYARVDRRLVVPGTAYFLLIGVGFMSAEIGLLQRLSVFLGHPIYALSIVLFSMILATGVGSLLSDRVALETRSRFILWASLLGAYLGLLPLWLPAFTGWFDSATLLVRAVLCVMVIAPAGVLMGYGFPTGMRLVSAIDQSPTPWFWGINGAASVLASTLAVACSLAFGISTTLMIAALCYLLLLPVGLALGYGTASMAPSR